MHTMHTMHTIHRLEVVCSLTVHCTFAKVQARDHRREAQTLKDVDSPLRSMNGCQRLNAVVALCVGAYFFFISEQENSLKKNLEF